MVSVNAVPRGYHSTDRTNVHEDILDVYQEGSIPYRIEGTNSH